MQSVEQKRNALVKYQLDSGRGSGGAVAVGRRNSADSKLADALRKSRDQERSSESLGSQKEEADDILNKMTLEMQEEDQTRDVDVMDHREASRMQDKRGMTP